MLMVVPGSRKKQSSGWLSRLTRFIATQEPGLPPEPDSCQQNQETQSVTNTSSMWLEPITEPRVQVQEELPDEEPPPPKRVIPAEPLNAPLVRKSMKLLDVDSAQLAASFYSKLFAGWPQLRSMFPAQMTHQNDRLFAALIRIVELLETPDSLAEYLTQLGRDHLKYGVQPEHYDVVGYALLRTLREHVQAWSDDDEQAWNAAYRLASSLMIKGAETRSGPPWWNARVIRHERRTDSLAMLTVKTEEPFPFAGGQYLTVQTGKWHRVWRPYSIASAPNGDGTELDLHVRKISGGWVSTALVMDTRTNDQLWLGPALGTMTPAAAGNSDILAVGGGTGLAPLKALAEDVLWRDEEAMAAGHGQRRMIHLFHGARTPRELYDMPELRELERTYPWLQVVPVVSGDNRFGGTYGNVAEVAASWQDWLDQAAFVAGPTAMVARTSHLLTAAGLRRVHYDSAELGIPGI